MSETQKPSHPLAFSATRTPPQPTISQLDYAFDDLELAIMEIRQLMNDLRKIREDMKNHD